MLCVCLFVREQLGKERKSKKKMAFRLLGNFKCAVIFKYCKSFYFVFLPLPPLLMPYCLIDKFKSQIKTDAEKSKCTQIHRVLTKNNNSSELKFLENNRKVNSR